MTDQPPTPYTRPDRLKREQKALCILGMSSFACVQELAEELAGEEAQPSGSDRKLFTEYLPEKGLTIYEVLPLFRSGLAVTRLTPAGIAEAERLLGDTAFPSEWQILLDGHHGEQQPEHTAMCLAFAREARARGFEVEILPHVHPVKDDDTGQMVEYDPDLRIIDLQTRSDFYIEVQRRSRSKPGKWYRQYLHQGAIAFVTLTADARATMTKNIEAEDPSRSIYATDLETLMQRRAASPKEPGHLWAQVLYNG